MQNSCLHFFVDTLCFWCTCSFKLSVSLILCTCTGCLYKCSCKALIRGGCPHNFSFVSGFFCFCHLRYDILLYHICNHIRQSIFISRLTETGVIYLMTHQHIFYVNIHILLSLYKINISLIVIPSHCWSLNGLNSFL